MPDPRAVLDRPAPPPDRTVRYGPLPDQVIDVRLPGRLAAVGGSAVVRSAPRPAETAPARPLVVVVHGGFWRRCYDRAHIGPLAAALAAAGWPVAVIEYRRTGQPGGGWPGTFDDVAEAVSRAPGVVIAALAERGLPPPPAGAILLGHSAGGQLALWYAATRPAGSRGVLALAPVADLAAAYAMDLDGGAVAALLGGGPADVPDRYAAVDPHVLPPVPVPTVILHGRRDRQVPAELSRRYARHAATADVELRELPDMDHFGVIDPDSAAWPAVLDALSAVASLS